MVQMELSDKSRKFIDDLKLYLFSSGKNEQEIKDITEEPSNDVRLGHNHCRLQKPRGRLIKTCY